MDYLRRVMLMHLEDHSKNVMSEQREGEECHVSWCPGW